MLYATYRHGQFHSHEKPNEMLITPNINTPTNLQLDLAFKAVADWVLKPARASFSWVSPLRLYEQP